MTSLDLNRDALAVAPELLNYNLCVEHDGELRKVRITSVEAYHGFEDMASHAHRGKTPRNAVMFGEPGYWYVYLCYGVHWLLNLVTAESEYPSAVLIRGVEGFDGPGKLTKSMGINKRFNEMPCSRSVGLWLESVPEDELIRPNQIHTAPRIGVDYAGEVWANKPWRFSLER